MGGKLWLHIGRWIDPPLQATSAHIWHTQQAFQGRDLKRLQPTGWIWFESVWRSQVNSPQGYWPNSTWRLYQLNQSFWPMWVQVSMPKKKKKKKWLCQQTTQCRNCLSHNMRQTITVTMQSLEKTKNMEPSVCSGEGACLKRLCHCELLRTELQRDHSGSHCQASSILNYSWESTVQKLCQAPEENASGPEIHSELPGP